MDSTVPLCWGTLPDKVGHLALGRLQLLLGLPARAVVLAADDTDKGLALPQASEGVDLPNHPGTLDHMVPTRVPDYQIKI